MSEACTHDCGNCSSDCGERTAPQSLNNANNKDVKKVIAVVSGKGVSDIDAGSQRGKEGLKDGDSRCGYYRSVYSEVFRRA